MRASRMELHWNRVIRCYEDRPANVDAMFRAAVAGAPAAEAVVDGAVRLTYETLDRQVDRLAAGLASKGVSKGDRVAVMLLNCVEAVASVLAIARLGAVLVPVGTRSRRPEIVHIFTDSEPATVIFDAVFAAEVPADASGPLRISVGTGAEGALAYEDLLIEAPESVGADCSEDDLFGILYTSGTTGQPKGAMLTHLGAIHSGLHWIECLGLGTGERAALCIPWSHVAGLCGIVLPILQVGGCLVPMREFKRREFLDLASREAVSHALLVPAMYGLCLLEPDLAEFDLSHWRLGVYGSAPMPEATIRRFSEAVPHLQLCNAYGATETTSPATIMPPGEGIARSDSIGKTVPCGDIRVMDEAGREVAPGTLGELWIRGPMIVAGYWRNETANEQSFVEGFWKSGDVGSVDEHGFVRIADRKKDMINRGGFKVYPAEVENVITDMSGVVEAAIVGRHDDILGERVVAFIRSETVSLSEGEIRAFCATRLSDYKVPDRIIVSAEPLPRNANGKIQKAELREMARQLPG